MAIFSTASPLAGGQLSNFVANSESPFNLDSGLKSTRPEYGRTIFPFPVVTGWIDGFCPQMNQTEYANMLGRNPYGPGVGTVPAPQNLVFPNLSGNIAKVTG